MLLQLSFESTTIVSAVFFFVLFLLTPSDVCKYSSSLIRQTQTVCTLRGQPRGENEVSKAAQISSHLQCGGQKITEVVVKPFTQRNFTCRPLHFSHICNIQRHLLK